MNTAKQDTRRARQDRYDTPSVVIERRIVVAEIAADPHGEHPMLRAALMAAADVLIESLRIDTGDRLEFRHGSHTFAVTATPGDADTAVAEA